VKLSSVVLEDAVVRLEPFTAPWSARPACMPSKPEHRRCEIGSTFYRPEARGGVVNPASKRLLLDHAFSSGAVRVEIITDALNAASQAAIRKLGATYEGLLRKHKRTWTGRMRDTVQFAILDDDWPEVRRRLDERLASLT